MHPAGYVDAIEDAAPKERTIAVDHGDTVMSPGTLPAVLRAVGGAIEE